LTTPFMSIVSNDVRLIGDQPPLCGKNPLLDRGASVLDVCHRIAHEVQQKKLDPPHPRIPSSNSGGIGGSALHIPAIARRSSAVAPRARHAPDKWRCGYAGRSAPRSRRPPAFIDSLLG